jgi:RNA polymerase sigma-70 factor (ECF subfamily)
MTKDEEILLAFRTNKQIGFKILMDVYQKPMYSFIRRMLVVHEDAEDVMQEVFIKVYSNLHKFRGESALKTWIFKIATNECMRFLNKRAVDSVSIDGDDNNLITKLMDTEYVDYENELAVKFQKAILQLPDKQRIVFNLRYYDDLDYSAISSITGIATDTVKVDYHYAKEKIVEYIKNN